MSPLLFITFARLMYTDLGAKNITWANCPGGAAVHKWKGAFREMYSAYMITQQVSLTS